MLRAMPQTARSALITHSKVDAGKYGHPRPDTSHIKAGMPITKISNPKRYPKICDKIFIFLMQR